MNKALGIAKRTGECFLRGFSQEMVAETTWIIGGIVGLRQGTKYKGSVKAGLVAGGITVGIIGTIQGLRTVFGNIPYIRG